MSYLGYHTHNTTEAARRRLPWNWQLETATVMLETRDTLSQPSFVPTHFSKDLRVVTTS